MIELSRRHLYITLGRVFPTRFGGRRSCMVALLLAAWPLSTPRLMAQTVSAGLDGQADHGISSTATFEPTAQPDGGDVLTPNKRFHNTPAVKLGLRAAFNRSAYTNDRYLNNVPFDVGDISGETDVYSAAAGFGYSAGMDLEYPLSTTFSLVGTLQYEHVTFGSNGPVTEPCLLGDTLRTIANSIHDFKATIEFLKAAASFRIDFSAWYLTVGIAAAHPLHSTLERTRTFGDPNCFYPESGGRSTLSESGDIPRMSRVHYSIRLGGGLNYMLTSRLSFAPELTLDFGSSALNKSLNSDLGVYSINATLRYALR